MKSYMAKTGEVPAQWHLVDAADKIVGRLATEIATVLMGKHKPEYTPHVDTGDFVVVINAAQVRVTGLNKPLQRTHKRYSGYPSGHKEVTHAEVMKTNPAKVITEAVRRMLPKNKLGVQMLTKLKVYAGDKHPHQAQQPQPLNL